MKKKKKIQLDRLLLSRDPQSQEVFFFFKVRIEKGIKQEENHHTEPNQGYQGQISYQYQ